MERRTVHYAGHVQGVGFRMTAQRIAAGHDVTGYVRNLADGRVELVAEGDPAELDRLLSEVADTMGGLIRRTETDASAASGEFSSFGIRY